VDARSRILRAAVELLASAGFPGLTISAVARASGVSRPTVYAHFGSREELASAVLRLVTRQVTGRVVAQARRAATGADFVVEAIIALRREFRREPALAPLAFPQRGTIIFDADTLGPDALDVARDSLLPLLDFHPELADELGEITETVVRIFLSLVMFESELSASDATLRGYLHRRLVPALGLPPPTPPA
jgi:AcrR family transcriptional regulator